MKPRQSPECEHAYPTSEETALWVALNRSQRAIYRAMDSALKANGLPPLRWYDVLWELDRSNRKGLRPLEIEKALLFEQSNLSRLLQRLVEEGLVDVLEFPDDGRGKMIRITSAGRRMRKKMWSVYGPQIRHFMGKITSTDTLEATTATLTQLTDVRDD